MSDTMNISVYTENAINTDGLSFIAYAKCGDMEIGLLPVAVGDYMLFGAQIEDGVPVTIFERSFETEVEGLRGFAEAITSEYAGA